MFKPVFPKTDFPALERELLEKWYKSGIVRKYLDKNKKSPKKFSFLDGPITANNPMGVHHAWGRTYKDFWQRFYNMVGYKQRFQNGFDEQGLWVEVEVEKELGLKSKKDIENLVPGNKFASLEKFIQLCKDRVAKFSRIQTEQSKRLGYFMDWDKSYHTSSDQNNYSIWRFLRLIHERGWLYKGRDSVPWCPRCGTAISQHEILTEEYKEISHDTIFFKLPVLNRDFKLLVWTTTPWTIPANVAVAVNPKFKYRVWEYKDEKLIIVSPDEIKKSKNEYDIEQFQWYEENIIKAGFIHRGGVDDIQGSELVGLHYRGPFDDLEIVNKARMENPEKFHIILGAEDLVVGNKGTGLLHVAPGSGEEDFKLAKEFGLPVIAPIEEDASYVKGMGEFTDRNAKKHPEQIIQYLEKYEGGKFLHGVKNIKHRYPTCWRCKTELVWRVVDEWYISMDSPSKLKVKSVRQAQDRSSKLNSKTYRQMMIEVAEKINWMPEWGKDRELDWLQNMHDWLISKKRYWGLALPIWECHKCKNFEVIGSQDELRNKAVEGWEKFEGYSPHRPWVDQVKIKCTQCGEKISRIPDVGNPWLDAGIVPFSTMPQEWFPADFITESFPGQFKNWFYSLIAMSTALKNEPPFKTVLGFASVRDEKGEEMHKSKGNAIEFNEAADKIGVDVMRWLYLRTNPEHNVNFGYRTADEIRRFFHLRLWNVYVFFVTYANADNWKPKKRKFTPTVVLDRWILSRMNGNIKNITFGPDGSEDKGIINFNAYDAVGNAEIFVIHDLSTWYVRRIRDRVGPTAPNGKDKDDAYQTLWNVLTTYSRVLAPFIPFIADEIYTNLTGEESVHLADWPDVEESLIDDQLEEQMDIARKVVELAHSKRKDIVLKLRIPLSSLTTVTPIKLDHSVQKIIADETNVKRITNEQGNSLSIILDTNITDDLREEGEARDIIRKIQEERKKLGVSLSDKVDVFIEKIPKNFEKYIADSALVNKLVISKNFKVEKTNA